MVTLYVVLARLERAAGNVDEALASFEKALHWSEQSGRLAHPTLREPLREYAELLRAQGRSEQAAALDQSLDRALAGEAPRGAGGPEPR
jgi:tetratricopeptide (TPR) repeat protein